jgi:ribosomal protein S4
MISKYNTNRKFIRMSWNKYNLFNTVKYPRHRNYFQPKRLRLRNLIYKSKLLAKQRLRSYYGNLSEIELKKLLKLAAWGRNKFYKTYKTRPIQDYLLLNLERRLDTIIFKLQWAPSIFTSRQLINHGHILVNGKIIKSCGYILSINDLIQVNKKSINFVKKLKLNYNNSFLKARLNKLNRIRRKYKKIQTITRFLPKTPKYFIKNNKKFFAIFIYMPNINRIKYPFHIKSYLVNRFYRKVRY